MSSASLLAGMMTHSLGWTLLLSLLQGLLIYGCLQIVLFATRKASARTRYHIRYAALVLLFGWFALTWWQQWERTKGISIQVTEAQGAKTLKTYVLATNPSSGDDTYGLTGMMDRAESYLPYLVAVYLAGVLLMSLRLLMGWRGVRQLKSRQLSAVPEAWLNSLRHLCEQLGITRQPKLFASLRVSTPMVIGALKPVILLPVSALTQLSPTQLEAILVHELAHIKRHDYLLNLFQTVMETLLCLNPFSWLIGSGIRTERELCCDDLVVTHTAHPLPYAQALATLEAQRLQPASPNMAMAATGHKQQLFHRIKRIMEMKTPSDNNSRLALALLLAAGLTICIAAFSPTWAQKKKAEKPPVAESTVQRQPRIILQDANGNRQEYDDLEDLPLEVKEKIARSLRSSSEATSVSKEAVAQAQAAVNAVDFDRIGRDVEVAMRNVRPEVNVEVKKALDAIDWKSINKEIADATAEVKNIDWNEIQEDIDAGLAEARAAVNDPALKEEIRAKISEAQRQAREQSRTALRQAREQAREARRQGLEQAAEARREAQEQAEEAQRMATEQREQAMRDAEQSRRNAVAVRDNARPVPVPSVAAAVPSPGSRMRPAAPIAPLTPPAMPASNPDYEKMLSLMEADDLIDRHENFSIRKDEDKLYINGQCQGEQVYRKYKPYLKGQKVMIKGNRNKLSVTEINND